MTWLIQMLAGTGSHTSVFLYSSFVHSHQNQKWGSPSSSCWYENENPRAVVDIFSALSWFSSIRDRRTKHTRRVPRLLGQPLSFLINVNLTCICLVFRSPLPPVKGPSSWNLLGKKTASSRKKSKKDRKILEKSNEIRFLQRAISTLGRVQSRQEGG